MDERQPVIYEDSTEHALTEGGAPLPEPQPQPVDVRVVVGLVLAALAVALVSIFVVAPRATSPQANAHVVASLDEKRSTVTSLMASSTASSAAISLLPGDAGTPIAEKLVDLSSDFMVVLAAIYLEKYLLAIMGHATFKFLVPAACAAFAVGTLAQRRPALRQVCLRLAARLLLFGLAVYFVVPASVLVSDVIERTYQDSIDQTLEVAEQTASEIEASVQEEEQADVAGGSTAGGLVGGLVQTLQQLPETLTGTVTGLTEDAQNSLNNFIDALAIMIVTSCVIPILVLLFFLWLVNMLLGSNIEVPQRLLSPRSLGGRRLLR